MVRNNFRTDRVKLIITTDFITGRITENQYNAIMHELDSGNSIDYKYGVYTMYLIMYMNHKQ